MAARLCFLKFEPIKAPGALLSRCFFPLKVHRGVSCQGGSSWNWVSVSCPFPRPDRSDCELPIRQWAASLRSTSLWLAIKTSLNFFLWGKRASISSLWNCFFKNQIQVLLFWPTQCSSEFTEFLKMLSSNKQFYFTTILKVAYELLNCEILAFLYNYKIIYTCMKVRKYMKELRRQQNDIVVCISSYMY